MAPDHEVTGRLDGKAVFGGTLADPRADLDLRATDVSLRGGEAAGLTGIDIGATGRWRNGRLALDGKAATRRRDGVDIRFQADLPLVLRREPPTVELPRNVPVSGALRGSSGVAQSTFQICCGIRRTQYTGKSLVDLAGRPYRDLVVARLLR